MNNANVTRSIAFLSRGMFDERIYSDDGGVLADGGSSYGAGLHVVTWKPWRLQIQEQRDGAWHVIHSSCYPTKAIGAAAAARMGVTADDFDYVGWHKDEILSRRLCA
jgi:hypothetical protein